MWFANPWALWGLLPLAALGIWHVFSRETPTVSLNLSLVPARLRSRASSLVLPSLRIGLLSLLVLAAARPQSGPKVGKHSSLGLDIVLVVDASASMSALDMSQDLSLDRLEVVKRVIRKFIADRPNDRLGLVVFGSEAFTQVPLTLDHAIVDERVNALEIAMAGRATAIGDAIAVATRRLKEVDGKTRLMILLTDGSNTHGRLDPELASDAAKALGVRIEAIGVGKEGDVPFPVEGPFGRSVQMRRSDMDEDALRAIAEKTGGRYHRADDEKTLQNIYDSIDKLEKSRHEMLTPVRTHDEPEPYLGAALLLLGVEMFLSGRRRWA